MTTIINIPLNQLQPSERNVRKTKATKKQDDELRASIAAKGLLQNLVVINGPARPEFDRSYEVIAGDRRLRALYALVEAGELDEATLVPCKLADEDDIEELGLIENLERVAMHPADEYEAFAKLQAKGRSIKQIAEHFGVGTQKVKQRMSLGGLHANILAAYRDGKIDLDACKAFTLTTDQDKQWKAYKLLEKSHSLWEWHIREHLTQRTLRSDNAMATFVGKDAYVAAGGKITADLFESWSYWDDSGLVERLALEKLQAEADRIKEEEGWKWVEPCTELPRDFWSMTKSKAKKRAGKFIYISYHGELKVSDSVLKSEDEDKNKKKSSSSDSNKPEYSNAVTQDMRATTNTIHQLHIARDPAAANTLLQFSICQRVLGDEQQRWVSAPLVCRFDDHGTQVKDWGTAENAGKELDDLCGSHDLSWQKADDPLKAFLDLDDDEREAQVALAVALSFKDDTCDLVAPNYRDHWNPTKENLLGRVTKGKLIEWGTPFLGETWAKGAAKRPKGKLAEELEILFRGDDERVDSKEAQQWLPPMMK